MNVFSHSRKLIERFFIMLRYRDFLKTFQCEDSEESYVAYLKPRSPFMKSLPEEQVLAHAKRTWLDRFIDVSVHRTISK